MNFFVVVKIDDLGMAQVSNTGWTDFESAARAAEVWHIASAPEGSDTSWQDFDLSAAPNVAWWTTHYGYAFRVRMVRVES